MGKALKIVGIVGLVVILLIAGLLLTLTLVVDPNAFKPKIEDAAAKAGYPLLIAGDLGWQFYPNIGITVGEVSLVPENPADQSLVTAQEIAVSVQLMPLLDKELAVNAVQLKGLTANLAVDANGESNWQKYLKPEAQPEQAPSPAQDNSSPTLDLAAIDITRIELTDTRIQYSDQTSGLELTLMPLNMTIAEVNLRGDAMSFTLDGRVDLAMPDLPPLTIDTQMAGALTVASDLGSAQLTNLKIANTFTGNQKSATLALNLNASGTSLAAEPEFSGTLALEPVNLANLLAVVTPAGEPPIFEPTDARALTQVALATTFDYRGDTASLSKLVMQLDQTEITGAASLSGLTAGEPTAKPRIQVELNSGPIDLDQYLPKSQATQTATPTKESDTVAIDDYLAVLDQFDAQVNLNLEKVTTQGLTFDTAKIILSLTGGTATIDEVSTHYLGSRIVAKAQINTEGQFNAELSSAALNARQIAQQFDIQLPEMADPNTLKNIGINLKARGTPDNINLSSYAILVDQTRITGNAVIKGFSNVSASVKGDRLDVDRYLPPPPTAVATTATSSGQSNSPKATEPLDNNPLPFDLLDGYSGDLTIDFDYLKANNLETENLSLSASLDNKLINLKTLTGDFYNGDVQLKGRLNARNTPAEINLTGTGSDIAIAPLMAALELDDTVQGFLLRGNAGMNLVINTKGNSIAKLTNNLAANLEADAKSLQIAPINIEKYVCQAIALIQDGKPIDTADWQQLTQLQDMNVAVHYQNDIATIKTLVAGVEQLKVGANGKLNLGDQSLDIRLPITITQPIKSQPGCPTVNANIIGKALSLVRCKGSLLDPLNACGLDDRAVREAAKDYAEAKVKERVQPQLDEKKEELKDRIDDALGEGASDLLKDIFKKKDD